MTKMLVETYVDGKYDPIKIVNSMVLAFSDDPFIRWIYPSVEQYLNSFPDFIQFLINDLFCISYTKDYAGAAFWLSSGEEIDLNTLQEYFRKTLSSSGFNKIEAVFEKLIEAHPQVPHHYLALLGVEPGKQGQGYELSLLESILIKCDRIQETVYLETCNPRSAAFYERQGFEPRETIQIVDCPLIFPMILYPQ